MKRPILVRSVGAFLGVAAASAALALVANGASGPQASPGDAQVTPALAAHYAILDRARVAADAPPADAVPAELVGGASSARLAATTPAGASVYVLPSDAGGVCVLVVDRGGSSGAGCSAPDAATAGAVTLGACAPGLPPGAARVVVLVPDGATDVHAVVDGAASSLAASDNVAVVESDRVPSKVEWTSDGRLQQLDVPGAGEVPADCATLPRSEADRGANG